MDKETRLAIIEDNLRESGYNVEEVEQDRNDETGLRYFVTLVGADYCLDVRADNRGNVLSVEDY